MAADFAFPPTRPITLNLNVLSARLRDNWHVYTSVRSSAQVKHAAAFAAGYGSNRSASWLAAFDHAAAEWLQANPPDSKWDERSWPARAEAYPGADAISEAERILGLQ